MQAFVPKNRKPKFDLRLKIVDLNNVPLVSGTSYVKWHLPSSTSAEHRGRTSKSIIRDHKVSWDYEKTIPVRLTIDRHGMLQETDINFEVLQEYSSGVRGETIILGNVKLNLSEYAEGSDDGEDGVTRRYLMQERRDQFHDESTPVLEHLQANVDRNRPPLKNAPVFGGIAGIMTAEPGEVDDLGQIPSISSKTREMSKLQDMYRQTLAASWAAQTGELPADKCIEEIFAGGDGWGGSMTSHAVTARNQQRNSTEDNESDGDRPTLRGNGRKSPRYEASAQKPASHHRRISSKDATHSRSFSNVSGRASIPESLRGKNDDDDGPNFMRARLHEVDEFTTREDLRSWKISASR
ncbi:hypothetical protein MMC07_007029 [Pseudocyphellaria aurata]|nr:hypothetical protein [Pseudocyphellaria aurata]